MSAQQTNLGIVVGVDGSPCSHTAVEWAARDAQMRNVALRVVQVVPPVITAPEGWAFEYSRFQEAQKREIVEHSYLVAQAHQIVEQAHKVALEASSSGRAAQITGEVLHGQIVPTLANISRQVAMVVLGYRGQGAVAGALLGSVSSSLVRHAHGPVAVIPEEPRPARPPHAPVVVGIDGSPTSGLAAEIAFDEASRRGVDLVALHAWSDMGPLDFPRLNWAPIEWRNLEDEQEKMLARRLSGWQDRYPDVVVHKVVVCDRPAPRLLELAQTAQLVVVGSHGRGGFPGMHLGSVSRAVVNSGQAPVIILRLVRLVDRRDSNEAGAGLDTVMGGFDVVPGESRRLVQRAAAGDDPESRVCEQLFEFGRGVEAGVAVAWLSAGRAQSVQVGPRCPARQEPDNKAAAVGEQTPRFPEYGGRVGDETERECHEDRPEVPADERDRLADGIGDQDAAPACEHQRITGWIESEPHAEQVGETSCTDTDFQAWLGKDLDERPQRGDLGRQDRPPGG